MSSVQVGRNSLCPCGSGKKSKKCCARGPSSYRAPGTPLPEEAFQYSNSATQTPSPRSSTAPPPTPPEPDPKRVPPGTIEPGTRREIESTPEHPFFVYGKGWTPLKEVKAGDWLRTADGWTLVHSVTDPGEHKPVYNLRVADHHTYFVGCDEWGFSVWAHNTCEPLNAADQAKLRALGRNPEDFVSVLYRNPETGEFVATVRGGQGKVALVHDGGVQPLPYPRNQNGKNAGGYRDVDVPQPDGTTRQVRVNFTEDGFADLLPHAVRDANGNPIVVRIKQSADSPYYRDYQNANRAAGFGNGAYDNPAGTAWHHHQDRTTMILVPEEIHAPLRHTGGDAMVGRFGEKSVDQVMVSLYRPFVTVYRDVPKKF